jgi:hypothetical protein
MDLYLEMIEKDYPLDLTEAVYGLIMDIRNCQPDKVYDKHYVYMDQDYSTRNEHGRFTGSVPHGSGGASGGSSSGGGAVRLRINMFDKSDPLYLQAFSIEEENGFEDICSHGSPDSIEVRVDGKKVQMNAEQFAEYLKSQNKSGDFRLASCSTGKGEDSFAQQLSKIMQNKIKAPDDDVYYIPDDGVLRIGSEYRDMGKWRTFDKGVEIL